MKHPESNPVTSCTIIWHGCKPADDTAKVVTRILQTEVQIRFYDRHDELICGSIRPMSDQQRKELFSLLDACVHEWRRDDSADADGAPHWQIKICTKGKCIRFIQGAAEPPPLGEILKDMLRKIVGDDHCYFY